MISIEFVQAADFIVEDPTIQSLDGGIKKTFTSQASPSPVVFKWDFGDGTPILKTSHRIITHEYANPGKYTVKHQACLIDGPCCYINSMPWCSQTINVQFPALLPPWLLFGGLGLLGLLLVSKKECDYGIKKECENAGCEWLEVQQKCIKKIKVPIRKPPKPLSAEDKFLIAKLREKGAAGEPICTGEVCRIGKWVAIARPKGQEPIIIHDP